VTFYFFNIIFLGSGVLTGMQLPAGAIGFVSSSPVQCSKLLLALASTVTDGRGVIF
jgi:hypothetical protein